MIIPGLLDAYVAMLKQWPALADVQILDGPAAAWVTGVGIAVGASLEEVAGEFRPARGDVTDNDGTTFSLTSVAWSGGGVTEFKAARDRVSVLYDAAIGALSADRSMRGSVSTAWIGSGTFRQVQTGSGVLVAVEFHIQATRF